jgi:NAD(P)-dependent dehydrogenase (short-subunit alcohol dehydrogenase family)
VELAGRIALVTGGGTGIGRAICLALAREGLIGIAVNYSRSQDDAESTAHEVVSHGCDAFAVKADVASEPAVRQMVDAVIKRYDRLDILINNAGVTEFVDFANLDALAEDTWFTLYRVNVLGPFYCSRAAAPALKLARGVIVNIASMAAHRASGSSLPYGVSKAALLQLTRGLARALAPEVRVNSVSPGQVITRWARTVKGEEWTRKIEEDAAQKTPLGTCALPEHVAQAVLGLVRSDLITGVDVIVDGGRHLLY